MKKKRNWTYKNKEVKTLADVPASAIGFIYEIETKDGKKYIGRKQFYSKRKTTVSKAVYDKTKAEGGIVSKTRDKKKSRKKAPVWIYKRLDVKETPWKTYTGSSKELNSDLKKGIDYSKKILMYCYNKSQMTYYETKLQMCEGVIEENDEYYYNGNILGKFFAESLK